MPLSAGFSRPVCVWLSERDCVHFSPMSTESAWSVSSDTVKRAGTPRMAAAACAAVSLPV